MADWLHVGLLAVTLLLCSEVECRKSRKGNKPISAKHGGDDFFEDEVHSAEPSYKVVKLKCPSFPYLFTACVIQPNQCLDDQDCGEGELCCRRGCNKVCIPGIVTHNSNDGYYDEEEEDEYDDEYDDVHPGCSNYLKCAKGYKCAEYVTRCNRKCSGKCPIARTCLPRSFPDQCEYKECPKKKVCRLHEVKCRKPPCYPEPRCVKKTKKRRKY